MKNHNRVLSITVAVLMLIALLPISAIAESIPVREVYSGYCGAQGSNVAWTLDTENGVLSITGTGEMEDYSYYAVYGLSHYDTPWHSYRDYVHSISISNGITNIGGAAFWGCSSLTSVSIPNNVSEIGLAAFKDCVSLDSITIPESISVIEEQTFWGCSSLASVSLSDGLASIGTDAFTYCIALKSITIPDSVTAIEDSAFCECSSLSSVVIGKGVTHLGNWVFDDCVMLSSVTFLGAPPTFIGDDPFIFCHGIHIYYTPEYASEWAPNGEQLWIGYIIEMIAEPEPTILFGDVNMDGELSFLDISVLNLIVIGMEECPEELFDFSDFNQDGRISFSDISELYCYLLYC